MGKGREQVSMLFADVKQRVNAKLDQLPNIIGREIVNYSLDAFKQQAWDGKPWEARKKNTRKNTGKPILIGKGQLRNNIDVIRYTNNSVVVGVWNHVPYARIHNEGGVINRSAREEKFVRPRYIRTERKGQFRRMKFEEKNQSDKQGFKYKAYQIHIPQRRFLGVTNELRKQVNQRAKKEITKAIKGED